MKVFSCPGCSAELTFKSKASLYAVCGFCKSILLKHGLDWEAIGKASEVLDDITPLQIGTRGTFNENEFEIVGRLRMAWENGYWNEWYVVFSNGQDGWLNQAQGFYAICFKNQELPPPPRFEALLGVQVKVQKDQDPYKIVDIKETTCLGSEGELPFPSPKGRIVTSVDLVGPDLLFANIEYPPKPTKEFTTSQDFQAESFHNGIYVEFDDLNFRNLREIAGWKD